MNRPPSHGTAVWSSPEWRAHAVSWLDEQLASAGLERRGDVEQPHVEPWATVLKAPTNAGVVWMKAAGPGTAFEAGLYDLLAATVPDRVLTPIATDAARGWMLRRGPAGDARRRLPRRQDRARPHVGPGRAGRVERRPGGRRELDPRAHGDAGDAARRLLSRGRVSRRRRHEGPTRHGP